MGLIKLAIIGGAAYYAGKKLNEGNNPDNGQQGYNGGCWRRKQGKQQQQQEQYSHQQGQGMTRDMQYPRDGYEYSEKTPLPVSQPEYPTGPGYDHEYGRGNGWGYAYQPTSPQDIKSQPQRRKSREMVKFDANVDNMTADLNVPPTYVGYVGYDGQRQGYGKNPVSPQQRMYPGQNQPRAVSPAAQPVFVEPKEQERERSTIEKLMWK